jgi:hypothetical protein
MHHPSHPNQSVPYDSHGFPYSHPCLSIGFSFGGNCKACVNTMLSLSCVLASPSAPRIISACSFDIKYSAYFFADGKLIKVQKSSASGSHLFATSSVLRSWLDCIVTRPARWTCNPHLLLPLPSPRKAAIASRYRASLRASLNRASVRTHSPACLVDHKSNVAARSSGSRTPWPCLGLIMSGSKYSRPNPSTASTDSNGRDDSMVKCHCCFRFQAGGGVTCSPGRTRIWRLGDQVSRRIYLGL